MENTCLECKSKFNGRSDKKFCSDQCRAIFNNRKISEKEAEIIRINSILRKNRTLLKQTNPVGKTTIRKEVLSSQGFDFRFFTHVFKTNTNQIYYFCYEYGYSFIADEKVLIVNWQPYMKASGTF
jgi:predicted nucleic acid-binding Zn ribbon protein